MGWSGLAGVARLKGREGAWKRAARQSPTDRPNRRNERGNERTSERRTRSTNRSLTTHSSRRRKQCHDHHQPANVAALPPPPPPQARAGAFCAELSKIRRRRSFSPQSLRSAVASCLPSPPPPSHSSRRCRCGCSAWRRSRCLRTTFRSLVAKWSRRRHRRMCLADHRRRRHGCQRAAARRRRPTRGNISRAAQALVAPRQRLPGRCADRVGRQAPSVRHVCADGPDGRCGQGRDGHSRSAYAALGNSLGLPGTLAERPGEEEPVREGSRVGAAQLVEQAARVDRLPPLVAGGILGSQGATGAISKDGGGEMTTGQSVARPGGIAAMSVSLWLCAFHIS